MVEYQERLKSEQQPDKTSINSDPNIYIVPVGGNLGKKEWYLANKMTFMSSADSNNVHEYSKFKSLAVSMDKNTMLTNDSGIVEYWIQKST